MEHLFSYGTLQLEKVQLQTFGRLLHGYPDVLKGYQKELIRISVDSVVDISGQEQHWVISYTGDDSDRVEGIVLLITEAELQQADEYETDDYRRDRVRLQSGKEAWAYVKNEKSK